MTLPLPCQGPPDKSHFQFGQARPPRRERRLPGHEIVIDRWRQAPALSGETGGSGGRATRPPSDAPGCSINVVRTPGVPPAGYGRSLPA